MQLVLAGGASASDAYARSLRQHENDKIRFFDYASGTEFDELLSNAMLFVLPSDLEGLSLALLEGMGAGLCVLASDIPENRELVNGAGSSSDPETLLILNGCYGFWFRIPLPEPGLESGRSTGFTSNIFGRI